MSLTVSIRLADDRDFQQEVARYVRLLTCPVAFHQEVQRASQQGGSYAAAYEHVETMLETVTGQRHYAGYEVYRVAKHRIQHGSNSSKNQLSLFGKNS